MEERDERTTWIDALPKCWSSIYAFVTVAVNADAHPTALVQGIL